MKTSKKFAVVIATSLLATGLLIYIVQAIEYLFGKTLPPLPDNLQTTMTTLITFGIAFVWKLMEEKDE